MVGKNHKEGKQMCLSMSEILHGTLMCPNEGIL